MFTKILYIGAGKDIISDMISNKDENISYHL